MNKINLNLEYVTRFFKVNDDQDGLAVDEYIQTIKNHVNTIMEHDPSARNLVMYREYYGHDGGYDLHIKYESLETDSEYAARIDKIKKDASRNVKNLEATIKKIDF